MQWFVQELVQKLYHLKLHSITESSQDDADPLSSPSRASPHRGSPHRGSPSKASPSKASPSKASPRKGNRSSSREELKSKPRKASPRKASGGGGEDAKKSKNSAEEVDGVHSNLSPLIAVLHSKHAFYFVYPYLRFSLFDSALHSPAMLEDSVAKPLFVLYQLLQLLNHCHSKGATLGDLGLRNIFVDARLWVQIRLPSGVFTSPLSGPAQGTAGVKSSGSTGQSSEAVGQRSTGSSTEPSEREGRDISMEKRVT